MGKVSDDDPQPQENKAFVKPTFFFLQSTAATGKKSGSREIIKEEAEKTLKNIRDLADQYESYVIEKRRMFHQYPELSFQETNTTRMLVEELNAIGLDEIITFPDYNGCIGVLKGEKPGPVVMLRADIDALPVTEATGLPFCSKNEGKMHACGHDNHMAMLLGAIRILKEVREEICGTVKFLFQAAEESCYGAKYYVEHHCLDGVSAIMGMHIWNDVESPYLNFESGNRMASCDNFTITVNGVSAHGSQPQNGRDALVCAASIIMNLQTFTSRRNDPTNPLVITVGTIQGGEAFNIIANKVVMKGTIRTYSPKILATLEDDLRKIIVNTAAAYECTAELEYGHFPPAVINNEELVQIARSAVIKLYGGDALRPMTPRMGSEDFAYLMQAVPGVFGFIGSHNEAKGTIYGNHNNHYTSDEDALKRGSAAYAQFAVDFLAQEAAKQNS